MVMVDRFVGLSEGVSETQLTVSEANIFVEDGRLTACGVIEHIAQSAAARVGYLCRSAHQPVTIGYIGAVSNFEYIRPPRIAETLQTRIEIVQEVLNITLIRAQSFIGEELVAQGQMKIVLDV